MSMAKINGHEQVTMPIANGKDSQSFQTVSY